MALQSPPIVNAQMLIRRPVAEVYTALIDPSITTHFWFSKSSGRLDEHERVRWEWEKYGAVAEVTVKALEPNERIAIEWDDPPQPVEWRFTARPDDTTLVEVTASGFPGSDDEQVARALDSMGGFTSLLADLKAWLEHGVELNLVADHLPDVDVRSGAG